MQAEIAADADSPCLSRHLETCRRGRGLSDFPSFRAALQVSGLQPLQNQSLAHSGALWLTEFVFLKKWLVALFIQAEAAAAGDSLCLGKRLGTFRFVALHEEVGSKCQIPGKMRYYNFCKN